MSQIQRFQNFLKECKIEARKVTWPTREELKESTGVVIATVAIISVFIFIVDRAIQSIISLVI